MKDKTKSEDTFYVTIAMPSSMLAKIEKLAKEKKWTRSFTVKEIIKKVVGE